MTRWALKLEYDGTNFVGWQRQTLGLSVQSVLEAAAANLADGPVASVAAGRTDSGVHAEAQVAHIDLDREITADKLAGALNYHLKPHPVSVVAAAAVPARWSARFSAIGRAYRYTILNRPARPALALNRVWHVPLKLNVVAMSEAAAYLRGRHDFTSFRAASCQAASPVRTMDRLELMPIGDSILLIAEARSFLHHQIRNIVGTLKLVGEGKWRPEQVGQALAAHDRAAAGPTAPPQGLTLTNVVYDPDPFVPGTDTVSGEA